MDESKPPEKIRHWDNPPWYGRDQIKERVTLTFLENQKGLSTTSRFVSGCRWSCERFLVRWERRIIPYPTEIHWRNRNCSYEFGCEAGEAHRWLLEYWWLSTRVWLLDRFLHTIHFTRWESSSRIHGPGRDWRENCLHPGQIIHDQNSER